MSLTRIVPASVPSLFHSSQPAFGSNPEKKIVPSTLASGPFRPPAPRPGPGQTSFTSTVPASVPSLFHSSQPVSGANAMKYSTPPASVSQLGPDEHRPGQMFLTSTVPSAVP